MKILVDILHPAHVHFFRVFREEMIARGHEVVVTARDKDITLSLLDAYGIPAKVLTRQRAGRVRMAAELVMRSLRLARVIRDLKPDVLTGIMGPAIALAGKFTRTPAVVFYDTEFAILSNGFTYPLASVVCTPDCYAARVNGVHTAYPGYHELAYLHPSVFEPDPDLIKGYGVDVDGPYFVIRFVSWESSHDQSEIGLSLEQKRALVSLLATRGQVWISSEAPLPPDLEQHRLRVPPHLVHHLIAGSRLVLGESATMSSEAAVLGVPAVFIAKTGRGYTDDEEVRYGLVRHVHPDTAPDRIPEVVESLLAYPPGHWRERRAELLEDKMRVTPWMIDFFESSAWVNPPDVVTRHGSPALLR